MKYRVKADVCFTIRADAIDFLNYIEDLKESCSSGTDNDETIIRSTRFHECKHDDVPPTICGNYVHVDFDGEETIHE